MQKMVFFFFRIDCCNYNLFLGLSNEKNNSLKKEIKRKKRNFFKKDKKEIQRKIILLKNNSFLIKKKNFGKIGNAFSNLHTKFQVYI